MLKIIFSSNVFKDNTDIIDLESLKYFKANKSLKVPANASSGFFWGCTNLRNVNIENFILQDFSNWGWGGTNPFNGCINLETVTLSKNQNLTRIPNYLFAGGCSKLKLNNLDESVTSIGYYAFQGCSSLDWTHLPDNIISIEDNAFNGCSSLEISTLPSALTTVGNSAFLNCSSCNITNLPDNLIIPSL